MCIDCGCGDDHAKIENGPGPKVAVASVNALVARHDHAHDHGHHHHDHAHGDGHHHHDHGHVHGEGHHHHDHGHHHHHHDATHDHHPTDTPRTLSFEQKILAENDVHAFANRKRLEASATLALNLMSSPGAGKTTLLVETLRRLGTVPAAVIEGDQQTSNDAERIRATGRAAIQINTGKGCHLDAHMVGHAIDELPLGSEGYLFIENVGNLVCPASFDLGERRRVVMLSVTEGEDKPLKYPDMFAVADLVIITKADLAAYVDFDEARAMEAIARVNLRADVIKASVKTEGGLDAWLAWLSAERALLRGGAPRNGQEMTA